jgi:hypothetical protein
MYRSDGCFARFNVRNFRRRWIRRAFYLSEKFYRGDVTIKELQALKALFQLIA